MEKETIALREKILQTLKKMRKQQKCAAEISTVNFPNGVSYAYLWEILTGRTENNEVLLAAVKWTNKELEKALQNKEDLLAEATKMCELAEVVY